MQAETITLIAPDGRETSGTAEVSRTTDAGRAIKAVLYAVGGLLLGGACIIVPFVHLVTTWALPIGGIWMAMRTMDRKHTFVAIDGVCPSCGKPLHLIEQGVDGGPTQDCPHCDQRLQVRLGAPSAKA